MATYANKSSTGSEERPLKISASNALVASGVGAASSSSALGPFTKKTSCSNTANAGTGERPSPSDVSTLLATGSPADWAHWLWHDCPHFGGDVGLVKRFLQSALGSLPGHNNETNHYLNETDRDATIRWLGGVLLSGPNSVLQIGALAPRGKFLLRFCRKGIELVSFAATSASQPTTTTGTQVFVRQTQRMGIYN